MALEMAAAATGALLTVTIQDLITRLSSRFGTDSTFMDLRAKLAKAELLLNDAEDRQLKEPKVKQWLDNLKDITFRIDDLSDEIEDDDDDHNKQNSEKGYLESFFDAAADSVESVRQSVVGTVRAEISEILNELGRLLDLAKDLGLTYRRNMKMSPRDTPWLEERDVFGREDDKKRILELLLTDDGVFGGHNIGVVPIVGMGGIGKTTLAQLVYDDSEVDKAEFELKAWVTVSTEFDVVKIMKTILQEINHGTQVEESSQLHRKLRGVLRSKKFLFVLDDVWDDNYHNWDLLMSDFKLGASGSRILVTTRSGSVGSVVKTGPDHVLMGVPSDKCWSIFIQHAFSGGDSTAYPELHKVGRKIVKKCKGLPLALKAMGGLLRSERDLKEWENVMNNHVWDCDEKVVLPSLWLSYRYLPSPLKQCFAYCSVFPQDYEFDKKKMVLWWMAEGFLPSDKKERRSTEETGEKYFDDLVSRSLFQRSSRDESRFIVHDLVHDLALFVSGEFCVNVAKEGVKRVTARTRHVSYKFGSFDSTMLFRVVSEAKHLRTIHGHRYDEFVKMLTTEQRLLRVLSLESSNPKTLIEILPSNKRVPVSVSFYNLKHLRYLNLSGGQFEELPTSVCSLINLQTLLLSPCRHLARLPRDITKLIKLRHLDITEAKLKNMPPKMGSLKELRTLNNFSLGDLDASDCSNINEIQELQHLSGKLSISNLQNAAKFEDVGKDILRYKANLKELVLKWNNKCATEVSRREHKAVLDALQPHINLEKLVIQGYQALSYPIWVGDLSFDKLASVELQGTRLCETLPPVGQLPTLLKLVIKGFPKLEKIGIEFYGNDSSTTPFQCLETLELHWMKSLKEWVFVDKAFPRLKKLKLNGCKVLPTDCKMIEELEVVKNSCLECFPLDQFPKLRKLLLRKCRNLKSVTNDGNSESLIEMKMDDCPGMESFPKAGLPKSLTSLMISFCSKLVSPQTRLDLQNLAALELLSISNCECESAASMSSELFAQVLLPNSLASLSFVLLRGYKSINGSAFQQGKSLKTLNIGLCNELESLPEKELPSSLSTLKINGCRLLERKYNKSRGESYQHISHIPNLYIGFGDHTTDEMD